MKNIKNFFVYACALFLILNMPIGILAQQQSNIRSIDIKYNDKGLSIGEDGEIKQKLLANDVVAVEIIISPIGYDYIALQTDLERIDSMQGLWREILPTGARDDSKFFDANNKLTYIKGQNAEIKIKLIGKIPNPTIDVPYKYGGVQTLLKEKRASLIKFGGTSVPEKGVYDSFYDLPAEFTHPDILEAREKIAQLREYLNKYKENPKTNGVYNLYSELVNSAERLVNDGYPDLAINLISVLDKEESRNVIFIPISDVIKRFIIENPILAIIGIILIIIIVIAGALNIISLINKNKKRETIESDKENEDMKI